MSRSSDLSSSASTDEQPAEVFSPQRGKDGEWHFSRRDFLVLGLAAGGACVVKGVCPRFGDGVDRQVMQAGLVSVLLRAEPDFDASQIGVIQSDETVRLITDLQTGWVEVVTRSGVKGWLERGLVDFRRAYQGQAFVNGDFEVGHTGNPKAPDTTYYVYLPLIVKATAVTQIPTETVTPTIVPTACPSYSCTCNSLPCICNSYPCPCNVGNSATCPCNSFPCSCNVGNSATCPCNSFPCSCNVGNSATCPCNSFPCICNTAPCSCNSMPCSCNTYIPCTCNAFPCVCNVRPVCSIT